MLLDVAELDVLEEVLELVAVLLEETVLEMDAVVLEEALELVAVLLDEKELEVNVVVLEVREVVTAVVVVVAVLVAVIPPGGSRCRMSDREFGKAVSWLPTARPFVLERRESPRRVPVFGIDGASSVDHELVILS